MSYTVSSSAIMTSYLKKRAAEIADKVPFDIHVTSGLRSPLQQANAMFGIIEAGGSLVDVYADDDFARAIANVYPNVNQARDIIEKYFDMGKGSSHGREAGLDFRTTGGGAGAQGRLTEQQIIALVKAVDELGFSSLREYSPPHLHVTLPNPEKKTPWFLLLLVAGGLWISRK